MNMMSKPKVSPTNIYSVLIVLAAIFAITGAWLQDFRMVVGGLMAALTFLSLQLGAVYHQYAGLIRLVQILNGLFMAFLRSQGVELEGEPPKLEEEEDGNA